MRVLPIVAAAAAILASSVTAEVFSDLLSSPRDESRALEIKAEHFWRTLLSSAEGLHIEDHAQLAADSERVISELPAENEYVREALKDALELIRRTIDTFLRQAAQASQLATDRLAGTTSTGGGASLLSAPMAIRRFVGEGTYSERLLSHIRSRQVEVLPALQGAASVTGDVLTDCRLASERGFDVLKYDIYNRGVPKTPESAKQLANRIKDISENMRKRFMMHAMEAVNTIVEDHTGQNDSAAATVVRSSIPFEEGRGTAGRAGSETGW